VLEVPQVSPPRLISLFLSCVTSYNFLNGTPALSVFVRIRQVANFRNERLAKLDSCGQNSTEVGWGERRFSITKETRENVFGRGARFELRDLRAQAARYQAALRPDMTCTISFSALSNLSGRS